MFVAVKVCAPLVPKVTLKVFVPDTNAAFGGNVAAPSLDMMPTVSVTVFTTFQLASTALTVTVKARPLVCAVGVPVLPAGVPAAAVSPGTSNCNLAYGPTVTVKFELATPGTVPSVAVMVVFSILGKVVVNALEDWPLVNTTEVVYVGDPPGPE